MHEISLHVNYCSLYLVMGNHLAKYWSLNETAEVLHDLMRSPNKAEYMLGLYDTEERDVDDIADHLAHAEQILRISCAGGACSTLDELIGHVWQAIDTCQSRNEDTLRMLHFRLLCEAYADEAHYVDRIPAVWLGWLVNADPSCMTDEEYEAVRDWETENELVAYSTSPEDMLCDNVPVLVRTR